MNGLKKLKQHIEILIAVSGMHKPGADLLRSAIAEAEKEQRQMMDEMYEALRTAYSYMKIHLSYKAYTDTLGHDNNLVTGSLEKAGKFLEENEQ